MPRKSPSDAGPQNDNAHDDQPDAKPVATGDRLMPDAPAREGNPDEIQTQHRIGDAVFWALLSVGLVSAAQLLLRSAMVALPPLTDIVAFLQHLLHFQPGTFGLFFGLLGYLLSMVCWYALRSSNCAALTRPTLSNAQKKPIRRWSPE